LHRIREGRKNESEAIAANCCNHFFQSHVFFSDVSVNGGRVNLTNSTEVTSSAPEWLRVSEAVHFSRLSKPTLYNLMARGLIKNVSLRERGQVKGTRLVSFDSLRSFLESRASGGNA
jgi:hypothetical protein